MSSQVLSLVKIPNKSYYICDGMTEDGLEHSIYWIGHLDSGVVLDLYIGPRSPRSPQSIIHLSELLLDCAVSYEPGLHLASD